MKYNADEIVKCVVNGHPVIKLYDQEIHYDQGGFKILYDGRWSKFKMSDWISKDHGNDRQDQKWNREFLRGLAWLVR